MVSRLAIALAGFVVVGPALVGPAVADPMNADTARRFVIGKLFAYNCFDGTRGVGRIYGDGSVVGTMQSRASAPLRFVRLPPGTLRVKGQAVCAAVRGMLFEPCFNLDRTSASSFRGTISGLGFAYCDFDQRRTRPVRSAFSPRASQPLPLQAASAKSDD
jgi:hypothetical protein